MNYYISMQRLILYNQLKLNMPNCYTGNVFVGLLTDIIKVWVRNLRRAVLLSGGAGRPNL